MHKLYELKDMLCKELEKYGSKSELTAGSLDVVDKLAHAVKNIDKILESYDGEYSNARGGRSYARGGNQGGRSNAMMGGSYAQRRDSRGRYSREAGYSMAGDEMAMELRELMADAPNEIRMDIQRIIDKVEQM
jgi:hypothetical protein